MAGPVLKLISSHCPRGMIRQLAGMEVPLGAPLQKPFPTLQEAARCSPNN